MKGVEEMTMPTMYTINQAAAATGLSYNFLWQLCRQKKIVFVRAGSKYLINMERLREFLDKGEAV